MKLIGITGKAGSGKDSIADHICKKYRFAKYAFADPLRAGVKDTFGLSDDHFSNRMLKETVIERIGKSPRQLLQLYGDFLREKIAPDILMRMAKRELDYWNARNVTSSGGDYTAGLIISDVRLKDEADWIHKNGGVVLHVVRPGAYAVAGHVTEDGIPSHLCDYYLSNGFQTMELLFSEVDSIIFMIGESHANTSAAQG